MARLTSSQRRARANERRARVQGEVAGIRAGLPKLDQVDIQARAPRPEKKAIFMDAFRPDDNIISSVTKGRMSKRKSAGEHGSLRYRGGDHVMDERGNREKKLRKEAVYKALDSLQELDLEPDNKSKLQSIIIIGNIDEMYRELKSFLSSVRGVHEVLEKDENTGKNKIVRVPFGFNDSNPENVRKVQEILKELNEDWDNSELMINYGGYKGKKRSESTRNKFLVNRRAARQGGEKIELEEKDDNEDELMEQYYQWKIQGHRQEDFPKFKEELNPDLAREEFLPPEPRREDDYSDLASAEELQQQQGERDEKAMRSEGMRLEEIEEMKRKLSEAQVLLRREPDQGITGGGLRESMAFRQDSKNKVRGEKIRDAKRSLRESSERDRRLSEEHQRVEEVKIIIRELKEIQDKIDPNSSVSDSVENEIQDLIRRASFVFKDSENVKKLDRLKGLLELYKSGENPRMDLGIIKNLEFEDEFLDDRRVSYSDRTRELEDEYTEAEEMKGFQEVRHGYQKRERRKEQKRADLGRQRARQEKNGMSEASMTAFEIAKDRDLDLEQEKKLEAMLAGFSRKGLSLGDLGRRDIDQIVEMALKPMAAK